VRPHARRKLRTCARYEVPEVLLHDDNNGNGHAHLQRALVTLSVALARWLQHSTQWCKQPDHLSQDKQVLQTAHFGPHFKDRQLQELKQHWLASKTLGGYKQELDKARN
jgi:hypothetical protein